MKTLARSACVAVLMILLAATASPALAKGPVKVAVTGPGVHTTLNDYTKSGVDVDLGSLSEASRIFDIYGTNRPEPAPDVAEEALGARFVLTWDMGETDIVQHAYPFAVGGAWVRFLPGQQLFGRPVKHGWSSAPALTEQMVGLGAVIKSPELSEPQQAATANVEPAAAPVSPDTGEQGSGGGTSFDVAVPAGLLLAGVLGVGGVLMWTRRATR